MGEWSVGQEVAITGGGMSRSHVSLTRVKRILKRFIECEDGSKFDHRGHPYPHAPYSHGYVEPATDEHREKVRRQNLVGYIERQRGENRWAKIPTDTLAKIAEALNALTTREGT